VDLIFSFFSSYWQSWANTHK